MEYNCILFFLPLKVNGIKQEDGNEFLPGAAAVWADPVGDASFSSLIEHGGFFQFYSNWIRITCHCENDFPAMNEEFKDKTFY